MLMKALVSYVTLGVAVACLLGCGAEHVTALDEYWTQVSVGDPIPGDPWGTCDLRYTCSNPDGLCTSWLSPGSCQGVACEAERLLIGCTHACNAVGDCPNPRSGQAVPTCVDGLCYLSCGDGSTCPSGHDCVSGLAVADTDATVLHVCMRVYSRAHDG